MRLLNQTHRLLLRGVRGADKQPGQVRRSQNWIGGSRPGNAAHVPPPPNALPDVLSDFERYIHVNDDLPAVVPAGLLRVRFETIHPLRPPRPLLVRRRGLGRVRRGRRPSEDEDVRATVARTGYVGLQYQPRGADPYAGRLTDAVLFGDYCLGFVRAMELDESGTVTRDEHMGHLAVPSGWDIGPDGYIYVSTFGVCETGGIDEADPPASRLWRAVPAD